MEVVERILPFKSMYCTFLDYEKKCSFLALHMSGESHCVSRLQVFSPSLHGLIQTLSAAVVCGDGSLPTMEIPLVRCTTFNRHLDPSPFL